MNLTDVLDPQEGKPMPDVCACCGRPFSMYGGGSQHSQPRSPEEVERRRQELKAAGYEHVWVAPLGESYGNMVCAWCLEGGCPCGGRKKRVA